MGEKKVIYKELLDSCFTKEEERTVNEMVLNSRLDVEGFVEHVLAGINKISTQGHRLLGFTSDKSKDYIVFVKDDKYLYEFGIANNTDPEQYHCTLRFNNIDPLRDVYALGYKLTGKQAEYYQKLGRAPLVKGVPTVDFTEWSKPEKK